MTTELAHNEAITDIAVTEEQTRSTEPEQASITAAQAKVNAVANLTMSVYGRASQLELTDSEKTKLQADFPDEAFRQGAGGKDNLIYIEHAYLRDRLNEVFGPGQWAVIPRSRWAEDFVTSKGTKGVRIYVEAMLCVRGCFCGEAIGDMDYYPGNPATNYGDAVEGAKSAALRRCAKELGIGLQAWKKSWCEGWWNRRRAKNQHGHEEPTVPVEQPTQSTLPPPVPPPQTKKSRTYTEAKAAVSKAETELALIDVQNRLDAHREKGTLTQPEHDELTEIVKDKTAALIGGTV